jgi:hypothetical protein
MKKMLYPKREQELTPADFKNPTSEYRAAPFWAWNNKLDKNELLWQIEQLKKLGFGGFHMHVRTGMATEYLSDEFMATIAACVEKAREEKMLAWLYDEDRWPSGAAGGIVTKEPRYRIRHLLLTRKPYGSLEVNKPDKHHRADSGRCENGKLIACFDVELDKNGDLESYSIIEEKDSASGFKLYAYAETALPSPWFNNQTYVNTLDKASIREFIRVTHDAYEKRFKKDFGGVIPAIFTDEPQYTRKGTLNFAHEEKDVTLPWTADIEDTFKAAYNGESLIEALPELLWDLPGGRVSRIRYHYHDHIAERFAEAFADQCGAWCDKHGIMLTGHMMEEPTLESQTAALGEAMRSYRSFQLPGIDMLCDRREYTTAKQAQSAARQMGVPGILSEIYGVTNWNFDFRGHKLQGDWQAALGVTVRASHLSWVSMNGEAKRDYPSTFNYQSPWFEEYSYVENHFARVASVLTRGKPICRLGVIHPIESYWLHWGTKENTAVVRKEMDEKFLSLCEWLLKGLIDFDYICEFTLPKYGSYNRIYDPSEAPVFHVGEMEYDVVVVPALETIRKSTLDLLEKFKRLGGRLIFLGEAPKYIDAVPDESGKKLWEVCEKIAFERLPILEALGNIRELEILDSSGERTTDLLYQLREETDGGRWLFVAHGENPTNPDLPKGDTIRLRIKGEWDATLYGTINGEIKPVPANQQNSWTTIIRHFYEHDSLLFKLDKSITNVNLTTEDTEEHEVIGTKSIFSSVKLQAVQRTAVLCGNILPVSDSVPVTLEEPNVLLLDMAEYALDTGEWRPKEEILRLDNKLRTELKWPLRGDSWAQPYVQRDAGTPCTLKLRFSFESEIAVTGAELALENAASSNVALNGEAAGTVKGWYVDKCIGKVSLPEIKAGTNVLEVSFPYGRKVDVEAMYILGDFGVNVAGSSCVITKPVRSLGFGDITRQGLPFYGGNFTYHLETEIPVDIEKFTLRVTQYRGHLLKVMVDGKDHGPLVYSPYEMEVAAGKGRHNIDLVYFGSRINTFGQLHCVERDPEFWWGPNSWRTTDANWSYEYYFWPQGVLKSPEIICFHK